MIPDFFSIINDEIVARTLEEHNVFFGCILELHDLERTRHPRMQACREGNDLYRYVRSLRHIDQVHELPTGDSRAAYHAMDNGLVQDERESWRVLAAHQISALGPELEQSGHALSRGLLTIESLQNGRCVLLGLENPGNQHRLELADRSGR